MAESQLEEVLTGRPKYDETFGPIQLWLEREAYFLELCGITSEREKVVYLLQLLPHPLFGNVMDQFISRGVKIPNVNDLKAALEKSTNSPADWNYEARSLKWDREKWPTMKAYYERLKTLTKLSFGNDVNIINEQVLNHQVSMHFRAGMPKWIKTSEHFERLLDAEGSQLILLAQRLHNMRETRYT